MGKIKSFSIISATLIETIVSLTIIVVITGITVMVYVQVTGSSFDVQKVKAEALIDKYSRITRLEDNFSNDQIQDNEFLVERHFYEHPEIGGLLGLRISVFDRNKKLLKYQNIYFR